MIELRSVDQSKLHGAFLEAFADYSMGSPADLPKERLFLRMRKNAVDYDLSVGAYDGSRLVGFTLVGVDVWGGSLVAYDAGTGIVPEFRGRGLARRMLEQALPAIRARGAARFVLEVLQTNEPAIRAYRKAGFETSRELQSFAAPAADVRRPIDSAWEVRPIGFDLFEEFAQEADWLPSFENRVGAVRRLEDDVDIFGAFRGETCAGAYAYSPSLRWFLSLVVRETRRRRGAGSALLAHAASHLPTGVTHLTAFNVDGGDLGMQAFLTRAGLKPLVDQYEMTRLL